MDNIQSIIFFHCNWISRKTNKKKNINFFLFNNKIYLTWANFGNVANGSISVNSCNKLLLSISVSKFGIYCSRFSAIRLKWIEIYDISIVKDLFTLYDY